jgi:serine/threonine-protein kinase HipA
MKALSVLYQGWGERYTLGHLADDGRRLLFEFSPEAVRRGLELSPLGLKLREAAYGDFPAHQFGLPGLVADALPDGWGMLLMDRLFRKMGRETSTLSPLDRLAFIGERAMGALTFEPRYPDALEKAQVELLEIAKEVRDAVSHDTAQAVLRELALMGGSPHGARPKVLVNYDAASGRMSNAEDGPGLPWLIKFQAQNEHKEVCGIEALYAQLAHACGIDMPQTAYFDLDSKLSAFGAARFDREDGMRVPMHTAAGALDANFRLPSSVDYTTLLRLTRLMTRDEREVLKAYERCVFNVIFNNRDDHPKNFSYRLSRDGQWKLSPAYDLTYCEGPAGQHQMDVCGEGLAPSRGDLLLLARQAQVDETTAAATIERMAEVAARVAHHAKGFAIRARTLRFIVDGIEANRNRMR